jgi:hypothetical protein
MRKVLVVVQFTITQILVVGTFIVMSQMNYFSNINMGFNKEGIITARVPNHVRVRNLSTLQVLENKLRAQTFVSNVSFSYTLPSGVTRNRSYNGIGRPDASEMKDYVVHELVAIDPSYLDLYEINLLAGRNLTLQDSSGSILINKALVKNLELGTPEAAILKELKTGGGRKLTVAGVIDDYYGNSLKESVDNVVMMIDPKSYAFLSVKLNVKD